MNSNETIERLLEGFPLKILGGMMLLHVDRYLSLFLLFGLLVFLDCLTRWMAISYERLSSYGVSAGLWEALRGIPAARKARLIRSDVMKKRGIEKIILYDITLLTSILADALMEEAGAGDISMTPMAVSYLAMTEALSILENLSDSGAKAAGELLKRVKK